MVIVSQIDFAHNQLRSCIEQKNARRAAGWRKGLPWCQVC